MADLQITDWLPAEVKPVYVGYYEREYSEEWISKMCDWWDGKRWVLLDADGARVGFSSNPRRWRGLAAPTSQGEAK